MTAIVTLIAGGMPGTLEDNAIRAVRQVLANVGAALGDTDWLSDGEACDVPFQGLELAAADQAIAELGLPIDAVTQIAADRRKTFLIADMDSTIVTEETLDELADFVGFKEKVAAITARAMNGELDFEAAIDERVALLEGLSTDKLDACWDRIEFTAGARQLVATMRENGAKTALVSGGFTFFTGKVRAELGFDYDQANILLESDGKLTGKVQKPVLDKNAKVAALKSLTQENELTIADAIAVGDGANDLPMLQLAGTGVAYHAKPTVQAEARVKINHGDLSALLYLQGYHRDEFVG